MIHELTNILGADRVSQAEDVVTKYARDSWPFRLVERKFRSIQEMPLCVIHPKTTEDVSKTLAFLNKKGVNVVPYGGGSSVTGAAESTRHSVVINMGKMNNIHMES